VLAIFLRTSPATLVAQLRSPVALQALAISLKTSTIALSVILLIGTPVAYALSRARGRLAAVVTTLIELPLVLPPAVAGIGLLAAFGRFGLLGGPLRAMGLELAFTQVAVVMALIFVAMPFHVRFAFAAFRSVDPQLLAASRTLGAGAGGTFLRIAVPVASPGEFGATLLFAGSYAGRTQTLPLAIYANLSDFHVALAMAALLVAVSGGLLVGVKLLLRGRDGIVRLDLPTVSRGS
jgi:molybdate transport system permease protein